MLGVGPFNLIKFISCPSTKTSGCGDSVRADVKRIKDVTGSGTQPKLVSRKIWQVSKKGNGQKKGPEYGAFFQLERWLLYSGLQYSS